MAEFCMMLQNSNMVFQNFNMAFQNFKGKGKGKGKGKDSGAGVGSTYANPGRPKSFQPTHQDRKQTGNIAEYFRRSDNTPKPVAPVFASAQMRGGLEGRSPPHEGAYQVL